MEKRFKIIGFTYFVIMAILIVGEVKCIVKAVNCNWKPTGKAEIIYTVGACTGTGAIIGYIDIKDE